MRAFFCFLFPLWLTCSASEAQTREYDFINAVKHSIIRDSANSFFLSNVVTCLYINDEDLLNLKASYKLSDTTMSQLRAGSYAPAGTQYWDCDEIHQAKCLDKKLVDSITIEEVIYTETKIKKQFFWQRQRYQRQYIDPPYNKEFGHHWQIWSISQPAFDKTGNYALVRFSYSCVGGGLCGYSGEYFFKKQGGKWVGFCFRVTNS